MNNLASSYPQHQGYPDSDLNTGYYNDQEDPDIRCIKEGCNQTLITRVCLFPGCLNNLICDSDECWREHMLHMNKVVRIKTAVEKWSQLLNTCGRLEQAYNETLQRKKNEFVLALEQQMKIRETPVFKAIDSKPIKLALWRASDLTSFASNLAQIDTSQEEFKDVEANRRIEKLRNINFVDGVQKMLNSTQNLPVSRISPPLIPQNFQNHTESQQVEAFCRNLNCVGGPITKVCLIPGCKSNRLVCDSDDCWREHMDHMNKVVLVQVALKKQSQLQDALRKVVQDYNYIIERKKKEFIVALEEQIKITNTPIFKALDFKYIGGSSLTASGLNSYVSCLVEIDTSKVEALDVEANTRIDILRNINVWDVVYQMFNPTKNLSFAVNQNPPPIFQPNVLRTNNPPPIFNPMQIQAQPLQLLQTLPQPQPLQLRQTSSQQPQTVQLPNTPVQKTIQVTKPIVINLEQEDDLQITEANFSFQVTSHINLKFDKKYAYRNLKITNGNKTISLPMGMSKLAILPQDILLLKEPKIQLVIEYQGGTFLGDGKNKFGLFCGSLNQCTYEEKNHKNQLIVMGDDGNYSLFGNGGEFDEFKIDDEKCQICLTFERTPTSHSLIFLNHKNVEFTIPVDSKADQVYFCIVLSVDCKMTIQ